nr:hypothetical protein [Bacteroidota bacterium]
MQAKAHGDQTTYIKSILRSFHNLFEYIMGSRVFAQAYSNQFQQNIILIIGAIFCVFTIIFFIVIYKQRNSIANSNFFRISGAVITITITIFVQYAITKSAIKPWHGNHVLLLWVIIIGLLLEGLFLARQKIISYIFLISISVACIAVQLLMANQSKIINLNRRGFQLVVWQPYSLKPIRQYIHNHPGTYIIADWEIGRPLALENHYSSSNNQAVKSWLAPFKEQYITDLSDRMVIRATNITQTVPDWSDVTMARFDAKFECIEKFKDEFGRTMYEIGYIRKNE